MYNQRRGDGRPRVQAVRFSQVEERRQAPSIIAAWIALSLTAVFGFWIIISGMLGPKAPAQSANRDQPANVPVVAEKPKPASQQVAAAPPTTAPTVTPRPILPTPE